MHARTWIILGLLTGAAIAVHRASHAENVGVPSPPQPRDEPRHDIGPRVDPRDDLTERVAAAPANRMAELGELLVTGVEVDEPPTPPLALDTAREDVVTSVIRDPTYRNIPVPRTFEADLAAGGDMQADIDGVTFSGDVGIENSYVIDGEADVEPTSDL